MSVNGSALRDGLRFTGVNQPVTDVTDRDAILGSLSRSARMSERPRSRVTICHPSTARALLREARFTGAISVWVEARGYGFIFTGRPTGRDGRLRRIFVHRDDVAGLLSPSDYPRRGDVVEFSLGDAPRGLRAVEVNIVTRRAPPWGFRFSAGPHPDGPERASTSFGNSCLTEPLRAAGVTG
jgi:cold shock CspA family protein